MTGQQRSLLTLYSKEFELTKRQKEYIMNSDQIKGNWKEMKGKAQQKWGKLTDDDLDVVEGNRKELVGKIQSKYGKTKEEAEKEVDSFFS